MRIEVKSSSKSVMLAGMLETQGLEGSECVAGLLRGYCVVCKCSVGEGMDPCQGR